jgi:hypothetical protein
MSFTGGEAEPVSPRPIAAASMTFFNARIRPSPSAWRLPRSPCGHHP